MKLVKDTFLGLISALIAVVFVYGGYTIYAESADNTDYYTFDNSLLGFSYVKNSYHASMNQFFNDKMENLNEILATDNFFDNPSFNPPSIRQECDNNNVSSYCVSVQALDIYMKYLEVLESIKGQLILNKIGDTENSVNYERLDSLLYHTADQNERIDTEIEDAKKVLEATISAYDEFTLAYPMHKKYQEVIKNLVKYKIALKDIRKRVMRFPEKFIDATSAYCE
jgi:menaquinone-dependent protoporphyrinogen IX oxidase